MRLLWVPRGLVEFTFGKVYDDGFEGIFGHCRPLFFVPGSTLAPPPLGRINFVAISVAAGSSLTYWLAPRKGEEPGRAARVAASRVEIPQMGNAKRRRIRCDGLHDTEL